MIQALPGRKEHLAMRTLLLVLLILLGRPVLAQQPEADPAYLLGGGDTIEIRVFGEPELSGSFPVSESGEVEYPLLGSISVAGLTANQVSTMLQFRLSDGFLVEPSVTAWLEAYQSQPVQVLGSVSTPGMYYLRGVTTVLQVLSEAGGLKLEGVDEIRITHGGEGGEVTVISYERMIETGEGNISLSGGDIVFVPERLVTVMGQVEQPGGVAFRNGMTVSTGLAAAGGALPTANLGRVYVIRGDERIRVNVRKVLKGKAEDVTLQAGDRLLVRESIF